MRSLFLAPVFMLAACTSPEPPKPDYVQVLEGACENGVLDACVAVAEIEAEDQRRFQRGSASMTQTGLAIMQMNRPVQQPRLRTTCTQNGPFLNCF